MSAQSSRQERLVAFFSSATFWVIEIFIIVLLPLFIGCLVGVPYTELIADGWVWFGLICLGFLLAFRCIKWSMHDEVIQRTAIRFRRANYEKGNAEEEDQFAKMFLKMIRVMELWIPGIVSITVAEYAAEYYGLKDEDRTDELKAAFDSLELSLYSACAILCIAMIVGYKNIFQNEDGDKYDLGITVTVKNEKKEEKCSSLIHHLGIVWDTNNSYFGVYLQWMIFYSMFVYAVRMMNSVGIMKKEFLDSSNHSILLALALVVIPSYLIYLFIRITINVLHSKCTK